jgi:hypothetical protein
LALEPKNA